ncbi:MAG TPA: hypothetical protein ACFYD6_13580 [Candidatus Brocadiia bacterium]|nr:hypothetical protein [Candidatus Brocadiales bacterium]
MYEYLNFSTKDFFHNRVTIAGSGRLSEDLDGHEPENSAFRDILDSYDRSYNGRIYYLYADIKNPVIDKSNLRLGRQYQYSVETILFDGAKYEQQIGAIDTYVFGGLRVSQYTSTYFDTVAGSGIAVRPFMDTRTNLLWLAGRHLYGIINCFCHNLASSLWLAGRHLYGIIYCFVSNKISLVVACGQAFVWYNVFAVTHCFSL